MERYEAILASAGSGKTFRLAHRYIGLLARDVEPNRIVALTFTRKAAGEMFDSVCKYLWEAARDENARARTADLIDMPQLTRADFARLLRRLLDQLHRTHLQTLDSFTVSIIQAFALELGLEDNVQILDSQGVSDVLNRERVLRRIWSGRQVDANAQARFAQAWKQATFGVEDQDLGRELETMLYDYHGRLFMAAPLAMYWGDPSRIWPGGCTWLTGEPDLPADPLAVIREAVAGQKDKVASRWEEFAAAALAYDEFSTVTRPIEYMLERLAPVAHLLGKQAVPVKIDRYETIVDPRLGQVARGLLQRLFAIELHGKLQRTQGIYRVIALFEDLYDRFVRRRGQLTFSDVQYLLTPENPINQGVILSIDRAGERRLAIDYRLDGCYDHWLLDEFQDTSDLQWEAIENLVEEVLQDDSGRRTFFCVGDLKQSIYRWRGANPALFEHLLVNHPQLHREHLPDSWRSGPAIIDTVNAAFADVQDAGLPSVVAEHWQDTWGPKGEHVSRQPKRDGCAVLLNIRKEKGRHHDETPCREVLAELINEVDPGGRGLSCAVLVRTNGAGQQIADFLRVRCPNQRIALEGRGGIVDSPAVVALLSLLRAAAHPGDTLAWNHVRMTPLRTVLEREDIRGPGGLHAVLRQVCEGGYRGFCRRWQHELQGLVALTDFDRLRLQTLVRVADAFDRGGGGNVAEFLDSIRRLQLEDLADEHAIRIMTMHKAKGLGFDLVFLPQLEEASLDGDSIRGLSLERDAGTGRPRWVLDLPNKHTIVADPVLSAHVNEAMHQGVFEELCLLYVALTRAKRGLYMLTNPAATSKRLSAGEFLRRQLGGEPVEEEIGEVTAECLYSVGNRQWYRDVRQPPQTVPPPAPTVDAAWLARPGRAQPRRVLPSSEAETQIRAVNFFARGDQTSRHFGSAIHELLEGIDFLDDPAAARLVLEAWRRASQWPSDLLDKVANQFSAMIDDAAVRDLLARPEGPCELWRERQFDAVVDGDWITGIFDRVVVEEDAAGKPVAATIIDYKSDRYEGPDGLEARANHHRPQLDRYGQVLGRLLALPPERIELVLLFTRGPHVRRLGQPHPESP